MGDDNGYQDAKTIREAMDLIRSRQYLLPGIQRRFTWGMDRIEKLFDSVMRGYPINTLMLWHVSDDLVKCDYRFYSFIESYSEERGGGRGNKYFATDGYGDFYAVIDGQQRLTSLYLGLLGTYSSHQRYKPWDKTGSFTKMVLCLDLIGKDDQDDADHAYDFKFRKKTEHEPEVTVDTSGIRHYWFEVREIMSMSDEDAVRGYIRKHDLESADPAFERLRLLHERIHIKPALLPYVLEDQDQDKVLEIFTRTNSGGVPLSKSDLIMAIAAANWPEVRDRVDTLAEHINKDTNNAFSIDKDFVLKSFLVLYNTDVTYKVKNFGAPQVEVLRQRWTELSDVIEATFAFLKNQGFDDASFRAKNAAIPLMQHFLITDTYRNAAKSTFDEGVSDDIIRWLTMCFLKNIFSGQSDSLLSQLRDIIKSCSRPDHFPLGEIIDRFKGTTKNYSFDDDFLDMLLDLRFGDRDALYVLRLLQGSLDPEKAYEQDHLHPHSAFNDEEQLKTVFSDPTDYAFARDQANWNSLANMQLLEKINNISKSDTPLRSWAENTDRTAAFFLVPPDTSLDFRDFRTFIETRRESIKQRIRELVR
ncbi:MAG: DUF262 domain-containing protein [Bifidobacterium crudilactis]|uniref:DUF262 domain-containing protein n=1 Tax=Bifidobacterium crudilactis TaxID=327277 RepID=UPI003A5C3BAF